MTLEDLNGVREWLLEDGRPIEPSKPVALGLCTILGCDGPASAEAPLCPSCRPGPGEP